MVEQANKRSSTSSSKQGREGGPAGRALISEVVVSILTVLLLIGGAESVFRLAIPKLSLNSRHLAKAPERAERIAHNSGRPSVLILGNSMSRDAIDERQLADEMGVDGLVEIQASDSSVPRDWYYELKNMFLDQGAVPSFLVLPVGDQRPLDRTHAPSEDLLYSFINATDLPTFFEHSDIDRAEDRAAIYMSQVSAIYAFRGRTQKRILSEFIPTYPELRMGMYQWRQRATALAPPPAPKWTLRWVELIDGLADKHNIEVLVVPLPTVDLEGRLRAEDREVCRRLGWRVVEPVADVQFAKHERPDGLHLTPEAKRRFSSLFAPVLASEVKRLMSRRSL